MNASGGTNDISVSIITPCYNGSPYLRDTIASALGQTRPPLEVIVIDDGSTDDSAAIAESFGSPVRVIRQTNQGESVARNRGIAEARGSHLLFLDADDLIAPEALAADPRPGHPASGVLPWHPRRELRSSALLARAEGRRPGRRRILRVDALV
jgi:glycosyltransferase involved in cell wall biosynthesis